MGYRKWVRIGGNSDILTGSEGDAQNETILCHFMVQRLFSLPKKKKYLS